MPTGAGSGMHKTSAFNGLASVHGASSCWADSHELRSSLHQVRLTQFLVDHHDDSVKGLSYAPPDYLVGFAEMV